MSVRSLTRAVNVLTVLLGIFGTWFFVLPTTLGGFSTYTVVSGPSMQPTYHTGDLVLARPARQYRIGQVVIYAIPDKKYEAFRVVHRVIDRTADGHYVTQGDNQPHADPWLIAHDDIEGGRVLSIPKAGYLLAYMRNPVYLGLLFGIAVTFVAWPRKSEEASENSGEASVPTSREASAREVSAREVSAREVSAREVSAREVSVRERTNPPTPTFDWALSVPPLFDPDTPEVVHRPIAQPVPPERERVGAAHAELDEYVREWASLFEGSTASGNSPSAESSRS